MVPTSTQADKLVTFGTQAPHAGQNERETRAGINSATFGVFVWIRFRFHFSSAIVDILTAICGVLKKGREGYVKENRE